MPRRKYVRDKIGRFAEVAGGSSDSNGRMLAIKKRTGKNAARREASSRLLRATRAKRHHEEFIVKATGR